MEDAISIDADTVSFMTRRIQLAEIPQALALTSDSVAEPRFDGGVMRAMRKLSQSALQARVGSRTRLDQGARMVERSGRTHTIYDG